MGGGTRMRMSKDSFSSRRARVQKGGRRAARYSMRYGRCVHIVCTRCVALGTRVAGQSLQALLDLRVNVSIVAGCCRREQQFQCCVSSASFLQVEEENSSSRVPLRGCVFCTILPTSFMQQLAVHIQRKSVNEGRTIAQQSRACSFASWSEAWHSVHAGRTFAQQELDKTVHHMPLCEYTTQ